MKGVPQSPMCGYSNYAVEVLKFYCKNNYIFNNYINNDNNYNNKII